MSILRVVLTGGPGGGKDTLIEELLRGPQWRGRISALPEAIALTGRLGISVDEKLFQRTMTRLQMAMEDGLANAFTLGENRLVLCNRGSLDPLAYWLDRGWEEKEFFDYTGTVRAQHYQRYQAVIHLVTSADGAPEAYLNHPAAHRRESMADAVRLDRLLGQVWHEHPQYQRIDNSGKGWPDKSLQAREILEKFLS
jgi:predicted ATPase